MDFEYSEPIARFYDTIYHSMRDGVDDMYYLDRVMEAQGPVLEIGAGTGRLFTRALRQGADIYAIDVSSSMLHILRSKLNEAEHARVSKQNATNFLIERQFQLIVAPFRVFSHLETVEEQRKALDTIWSHLKPGGQFIFDLFVPDPRMLATGLDRVKDFEGEYQPGEVLRRIVSSQSDCVNQVTHVHFRLEWTEKGEWYSHDWDFNMRYFYRYELEHLFARSNFVGCSINGDFKGSPLLPSSREFVITANR